MVWPQKAVGKKEETGCRSLWLGGNVLHSFRFLHARLKLKAKKKILALAVGTTQM